MNLNFISKIFDFNTKLDHSETFSIQSNSQVIIKVATAFISSSFTSSGIGEVVAAGSEYLKLIGKTVEYSLMTGTSQVKEYEICEGKFCFVTKSTILVNEALTALMLAEFIKDHKPKYVVHVSGSYQISKFLARLVKSTDLVTVNKPSNAGVLEMLRYDMLIVGQIDEELVFEEKTPVKSVVFQYSWNCKSRILHSGTFVKQTVFDWFSKLSFIKRKQILYFAQFNSALFENDLKVVSVEEYVKDSADELVALHVPDVFNCDLASLRDSICSRRVTNSGINSLCGSLFSVNVLGDMRKSQSVIEEVVNVGCLASPRCPILELTPNSDDFLKEVCESIRNEESNSSEEGTIGIHDNNLIEHLSQLIIKYSDPEVMKVLTKLSSFFNEDVQNTIKVFIKFLEDDSSVYEGQMNDLRRPEGFGSRYFSDGTVFRGYWKDGKAEGKGILSSTDGMLYVGIWKKGLFHGYGSLLLKDGTYREGYFRKGELNGFGIEILPSGERYHGSFLSDQRHDGGEILSEKGERHLVGHFKGVPIDQRKSKTLEGFQVVDFLDKTWKLSGINLLHNESEMEFGGESFSASSVNNSETFSEESCN